MPWHVAHQYELAKLFKRYDLIRNHYRTWGDVSRPMPENMAEVLTYSPGDYDMAILHVDQQTVHPGNNKYRLFMEMRDLTEGLPRVVINHMTPYDDQLEKDEVVRRMRELIGAIPMVVNSQQAYTEWGWGTPIIHGLDVREWRNDLPKEPRIITTLSPAGMERAYRREFLHVVIELLKEQGIPLVWIQAQKKFKSFDEYREYIGRSLIYFNPTWQSPMPRARTEAMLSGCCIVSTRHHDWDSYIQDGKNGFIVPDNPQSAVRVLVDLLVNRPDEAFKIGQAGRLTAMTEFSIDRWAHNWERFIIDTLSNNL